MPRSLTKSYGTGDTRVMALRGVDLDVYCGELLMLVGPSGCGKTTLISIIAAILDQDGGTCRVLDRDVQPLDRSERARFRGASIGFVFQSFNLPPALTAMENVTVPLLLNGVPRKRADVRTRAALDRMDRAWRTRQSAAGPAQWRPAAAGGDRPGPRSRPQTDRLRRANQQPRSRHRALVVVTHDARILEFADTGLFDGYSPAGQR